MAHAEPVVTLTEENALVWCAGNRRASRFKEELDRYS
jgi:hypothetical protein